MAPSVRPWDAGARTHSVEAMEDRRRTRRTPPAPSNGLTAILRRRRVPDRICAMSRQHIAVLGVVSILIGAAGVAMRAQAPQSFDILIRQGRVYDGSGNPWRRADIGIIADRIVAVG